MILKAEKICKAYGQDTILEDLCFSAGPSESVAVLGASGRGKSTLISILGLLLAPDRGRVMLDGRDIFMLKDKEQSKIRNESYGFLFQNTQLIGSITALDNVLIPAFLSGRNNMVDRAEMLLEELGLAERIYHYPYQLSIGQKRRVSLARALLMDPQIIFADEPTNDLDGENAELVGDTLFGLTKKGKTLIIVTHDKELAARAQHRMHL